MIGACLLDTDVVSDRRKGARANKGVRQFFESAASTSQPLYLSVITVGELRRGVEALRNRGDTAQAEKLESWLQELLADYRAHILEFSESEAQVWGRLRVERPENAIDKQIAATALTHGLTLVTGNVAHFRGLGVEVLNPFDPAEPPVRSL
jgi:predicted nucleic acid-binding protein